MFSGLSNYLKKILPKRLFYRALLIVAIPVLVLQLVITIVFFDSLWIKTNKGMTRTLINEISIFIKAYESEENEKKEVTNLFALFLDLNIELKKNEEFKNQYNERWFSPIDQTQNFIYSNCINIFGIINFFTIQNFYIFIFRSKLFRTCRAK